MASSPVQQVKVPQPTKLRGVTNRNKDKSKRQDLIVNCRRGEALAYEHDVDRPITWALNPEGQWLGYFTEERSNQIRALESQGLTVIIRVLQLTGGDRDNFGLNVEIDVSASDRRRMWWRNLFYQAVGCLIVIGIGCALLGVAGYLIWRFVVQKP